MRCCPGAEGAACVEGIDAAEFLWFVTNDPRLSKNALALIAEPTNVVVVSRASYWEVVTALVISGSSTPDPFSTTPCSGWKSRPFRPFGPVCAHHSSPTNGVFHKRGKQGDLLSATRK
jgi:hypothetical protein